MLVSIGRTMLFWEGADLKKRHEYIFNIVIFFLHFYFVFLVSFGLAFVGIGTFVDSKGIRDVC